jgi:hypothetical protein
MPLGSIDEQAIHKVQANGEGLYPPNGRKAQPNALYRPVLKVLNYFFQGM